ncbi:MAG: NifU family protein [Actinobacteria bacterium]|jgi:Fe-S cluster biogenesis protein NfuA|nr:NifU family protein [Actinomycetota bacterium]
MLTQEDMESRESELARLMEMMREAIQQDGGDLELVSADVESGVIEVRLTGACSSCAISSVTLQGGVERILHERLDWVTAVHSGVDEDMDPFESAFLGRGNYVPQYIPQSQPMPD